MSSRTSAVQRILDDALAAGVGSGYAFSIGSSGGSVMRGVGGADRHDGVPVEETSLWDVASLTKVVVGTAYARLVEAGALHLGQPVRHFLPDFATSPAGGATVLELLAHTSGLPGQQRLYQVSHDLAELRAAVAELPVRQAAGTAVEYSSAGFMVLGWIVEKVTGQRLDAALDELVLGPFAMPTAAFRAADAAADGTVSTEQCQFRGRLAHGFVHDENAWIMDGIAGHAGLFASLADLEAFAIGWLRAVGLGDDRVVRPRTVQVWVRNHTAGLGGARGLGWQLAADPAAPTGDLMSQDSFGHTGFTGTSLYVDPQLDRYGILLTNRVHPSRDDERIADLRKRFYNLAVTGAGE